MTMSSIGLPALNGFIGELLILQGVFVANKIWAAFAASGVVLGAAYMLWLYQRTMFGKIENPKNEQLHGPELPRVRDLRAAPDPRRLDRPVSEAVHRSPADLGRSRRRADQSRVPRAGPAVRQRRADPERGTRNRREPASACRHQPERFLLPAAGDRSHDRRAAVAARRSDDAARQAVDSRVGDAGGARRDGRGAYSGGRRATSRSRAGSSPSIASRSSSR